MDNNTSAFDFRAVATQMIAQTPDLPKNIQRALQVAIACDEDTAKRMLAFVERAGHALPLADDDSAAPAAA